ncbi:MAG: hypothetical protein H5T69_13410 [Chloroflexi bacterium]|nr:hypothetical protein [Chloroflexota bacterium]
MSLAIGRAVCNGVWVGYFAVLKARFRMLLQYRAAAFAGVVTQSFWGLMRVMIFEAFYRSTTAALPMSFQDTVTYLWLIQAMLLLLPWRLDAEVQAMIRDGTVAYELARPADVYWLWYCRNLAGRAAPILLRCVPMFVLAGLFWGLQPPASLMAGLGWALGLLGALLLSAALGTLMCISLFWTISGDGLSRLLAALALVFSGAVVPLPLFPDWAQPILAWLPFRGLMDTPFRLYMGHIPHREAPMAILHQWAWVAILVWIGRWALARGLRRVVVQGG